MKKFAIVTIFLLTFQFGKTQSLTVNATGSTCFTCCDGSMTITLEGCTYGVTCLIYPWMTPTSYISSRRWIYDNVCCGQYTATIGSGEDPPCRDWQYIYVDVPCIRTGLRNQNRDQNSTLIFPNPVTDKCILKIDGHKTSEVSDLLGNIVRSISSDTKEVDLSDLREGMYIFSIYSDNGKLIGRQKLIRN